MHPSVIITEISPDIHLLTTDNEQNTTRHWLKTINHIIWLKDKREFKINLPKEKTKVQISSMI